MALVKCSECGAKVSEKALTCPTCGHPLFVESLHRKSKKSFLFLKSVPKKFSSEVDKQIESHKVAMKKVTILLGISATLLVCSTFVFNYAYYHEAKDLAFNVCRTTSGQQLDTYEGPVKAPRDIVWDSYNVDFNIFDKIDFEVPYIGGRVQIYGTNKTGEKWVCWPNLFKFGWDGKYEKSGFEYFSFKKL